MTKRSTFAKSFPNYRLKKRRDASTACPPKQNGKMRVVQDQPPRFIVVRVCRRSRETSTATYHLRGRKKARFSVEPQQLDRIGPMRSVCSTCTAMYRNGVPIITRQTTTANPHQKILKDRPTVQDVFTVAEAGAVMPQAAGRPTEIMSSIPTAIAHEAFVSCWPIGMNCPWSSRPKPIDSTWSSRKRYGPSSTTTVSIATAAPNRKEVCHLRHSNMLPKWPQRAVSNGNKFTID